MDSDELKTNEFALLASMLVDPCVIPTVVEIVADSDFLDKEKGKAYRAIVIASDAGHPIHNPIVLKRELRRAGVADDLSDDAAIGRLITGAPHAAHARYYAEFIRDAAALRRLSAIGLAMSTKCDERNAVPAQIAEWTAAQLAMTSPADAAQVVTAGAVAKEIMADLRAPNDRSVPLMTGLTPLDEFTGGLHSGELIILAARPSIGKTALGLQVAEHVALQGKPVLVVSLEMRDRELVARTIAGAAGVDGRRMRMGINLCDDELSALDKAAASLEGVPLRIWAPPSATLARIRAIAKYAAATGGLALIVVDYLGLVLPADPYRPRHEQIAEVSAGLKALAKELSVPVLALCQLNREAEKEAVPLLSHLRDSGAIEQDADIVLLLHRDRLTTDATDATVFIAKHRHGTVGTVNLAFDPEATRFVERNQTWEPNRRKDSPTPPDAGFDESVTGAPRRRRRK